MKTKILLIVAFLTSLIITAIAQTNDPAGPVAKAYDWDIGKLAADAAPIMAGVLAVGALLKHAIAALDNRWIPLITWALGTVGFVLKSGDHSLTGIFVGVLVAAAATGVHSGIKNTFESSDAKPTPASPT